MVKKSAKLPQTSDDLSEMINHFRFLCGINIRKKGEKKRTQPNEERRRGFRISPSSNLRLFSGTEKLDSTYLIKFAVGKQLELISSVEEWNEDSDIRFP